MQRQQLQPCSHNWGLRHGLFNDYLSLCGEIEKRTKLSSMNNSIHKTQKININVSIGNVMKTIGGLITCVCRDGIKRIAAPKMLAVIFILAVGIFLRIWQCAANRSLWLDEASLALNIIRRSFTALIHPLDYSQAAPLGFLFVQKAIILILGNSEYSLRLFPLMAGICSLLLMYRVATKYLQGSAIYIALALFSISAFLIYYSAENKQYSSDVMFTLIILLAAHPCLTNTAGKREYVILAVLGTVAIWMSYPAVFVTAGIGIALAVQQFIKKDWRVLFWLGLTFLPWLANFAFIYYISLRFTAANSFLIRYWNSSFMPMPPWNDIGWFGATLKSVMVNPFELPFITFSAILLAAGLVSILLRKWHLGLAIVLPIVVTLAVSGLQKYPFGDRLILFLVPLIFILIAEGLERIRIILSNYSRFAGFFAGAAMILLLLIHPAARDIKLVINPDLREHIRPVIEYVKQHKNDSDVVYLHHMSKAAFMYYAPFYGFKDNDYFIGIKDYSNPEKYWKEIDALRGDARVWFIFSHTPRRSKVDEKLFYLIYLNKIGRQIDSFFAPGAAAYLYDLRGNSSITK